MKPQGLKSPLHQVSYNIKGDTMANEVVKYANELNKMGFASLSPNQQNILFTFFTLFKETENNKLVISLDEIIELAELDKSKTNTNYLNTLLDKLRDLQSFTFRFEPNPKTIEQVIIFPKIRILKDEKTLEVEINSDFKKMYLAVYSNFTRFYLKEFSALPSTYTKTIYRNLRQFQTSGIWSVSYDEFKRLLEIPKSYKSENIDQRILKPSLKILGEKTLFDFGERTIFDNLQLVKCDKNGDEITKGKKIKTLNFYFKPIPKSKEQKAKELKATFEKAKNDRESELNRANQFYKDKWLKFENKKDPTRNQHEPQRYGLIQKIFFDDERKEFAYTFLAYFKKPAQINSNFEAETTITYESYSELISFLNSHLAEANL